MNKTDSIEGSERAATNGSAERLDRHGRPWLPGAGMQYRRFGATGLRLPVLSCGGMRFMYFVDLLRHKFGGRRLMGGGALAALLALGAAAAAAVGVGVGRGAGAGAGAAAGLGLALAYYGTLLWRYLRGNQANLQACLEAAFAAGITHIETAKMYGTSEQQIGKAFSEIWARGQWKREDIILQTKVRPTPDKETLLRHVNESLQKLRVTRIDLLSIHGVNTAEESGWAIQNVEWLQPLVEAGTVGHIGFSTHAKTSVILDTIRSGKFAYVNLHKHYFGSYSALDNMPAVEEAERRDMGVFVISPSDKGGKLYAPPARLADACRPLGPMLFHDLWLLTRVHGVHTLSLGAAQPSDFDAHLRALALLGTAETEKNLDKIDQRLTEMKTAALGEDYCARWHEGLPDWEEAPGKINIKIILWLRTLVYAYGMEGFARDRYLGLALEGAQAAWYPGGRAGEARRLADQIRAACQGNPWADQIPHHLEEMHELLFPSAKEKNMSSKEQIKQQRSKPAILPDGTNNEEAAAAAVSF